MGAANTLTLEGLTEEHYTEAISLLNRGLRQFKTGKPESRCAICRREGHEQKTCQENPLLLITIGDHVLHLNPVWRCFHCDAVFTSERAAAQHFGLTLDAIPACKQR
jgi:hypothetical protein